MQTSLKTKSEQTPVRDKLEVARERSSIGLDTGARLRDAARALGDSQALADSYLITESAILENYFLSPQMHNEHNEEYEGLFTLTADSTSRLCPNYMSKRAHSARKVVDAKIKGIELRVGCTHKLVTLTKPKLIGVGVQKDFKVFDDALVRLRRSKWWRDRVFAAVKGEEVTLGDRKQLKREKRDWSFERDGYHVHAHLLAYSKFLDWEQLGNEWKKWLEKAAKKHCVKLEFNTEHGRPIIDIRQVKPKVEEQYDKTESGAIYEVCKYVVKGSDFARVPPEQLLDIDKALRGRRMLEFWGEYNNRKGYGTRSESREAATAYVHEKKQLTVSDSIEPPTLKEKREPTFREIGAEMCAAGKEKEWAEMVREKAVQRREWRKTDLSTRYPSNIFYRVDGKEVFYGMNASPACAFERESLETHRAIRILYNKLHAPDNTQAAAEDRAEFSIILSDTASTNVEAFRDHVRQQEEERWSNFVEYGREILTGGESVSQRLKIKRNLRNAELKKPIEQRADERELRTERIRLWSVYEASKV